MLLQKIPECYKNVREIQILVSDEQTEFDNLSLKVNELEADQFVMTATKRGLEKREKYLRLQTLADDSLDDRKERIIREYNKQLPYTETTLNRALNMMCGDDGYEMKIDYQNNNVIVRIRLAHKDAYQEVETYLEKCIPLNMTIDLSLLYNTHKLLSKYTHKQLSAYTHKQLREEMLS
ncbi:phage-like element PBSX protein xkdT [Lachnospiraceae bacterium KM106-2]|nr:phage-like element PBSX protein xkdT [Lachnospiraceae bacterium KM106-2]